MNTTYETERLILRVGTRKDAPMVLDFYKRNLEEFARYEPLTLPASATLKYHEEMLEYEYQGFIKGSSVRYFFFEKGNPFRVIGTMSFRNISGGYYSSSTVGYKVDSEYRRRGYAREALTLGLDIMENDRGLRRTEAYVMPVNEPSICLLTGLGFEKEGLLREKIRINGVWEDHLLYARIRS